MKNDKILKLYQETILDHNKHPKNFRKIEKPTYFAEGYNQLCGDDIKVYLSIDGEGVITDVSFTGDISALTKASASLMSVHLKGKTTDEARHMFKEFIDLLNGKLDPEQDDHHLGELAIFSAVLNFPTKIQCAALGWYTLIGAINKQEMIQT